MFSFYLLYGDAFKAYLLIVYWGSSKGSEQFLSLEFSILWAHKWRFTILLI